MSETTVPVDVADQQLEISNPHTLGNSVDVDIATAVDENSFITPAAAAAITTESGNSNSMSSSSPVSGSSSSPDNAADSSNPLITIIDQEAAAAVTEVAVDDDDDDDEAFLSAVERVLHSVDRQLRSNAAFLKLPLSYITPHIMQHLLQQRLLTTTAAPTDGFQVQYLDLTGNMLGDAGAAVIAEHLLRSDRCTVQYLNLSMNQIGSDGCRALCEALMTRKDVEHDHHHHHSRSNISGNDSGASSSVVSVTPFSAGGSGGNTSLQHLDISVNQIGFGGIAALCDMLRANSTLVSLNVRSNRMRGDKCVTKLLELSAIAQNKINFKDLFV